MNIVQRYLLQEPYVKTDNLGRDFDESIFYVAVYIRIIQSVYEVNNSIFTEALQVAKEERDWELENERLTNTDDRRLLQAGDIIYLHGDEFYRSREEAIEFMATMIMRMKKSLGIRNDIMMKALVVAAEDRNWRAEFEREQSREFTFYNETNEDFIREVNGR